LGAFSGSFDLAAAMAVVGVDPIETESVADLLTGLIDCSLVTVDVADDGSRYRLLETIRQYAEDQLVEAGEVPAVPQRKAIRFAGVCRAAGPGLEGPRVVQWVRRLGRERSDLLGAFDWHLDVGEPAVAWEMCGALTFFWVIAGLFGDARRCFERCRGHVE